MQENRFPPAMRDLGTPEEMSPRTDGLGLSDAAPPIVEVNRPVAAGEPTEVREPLPAGDIREEQPGT